MFNSKIRSIIYPQIEHSQMAGVFASYWGNDIFDKPQLPMNSFIKGVTTHDYGYGKYDQYSIGKLSKAESYHVFSKLLRYDCQDNIAECVGKYHILRLIKNTCFRDLEELCLNQIEKLVSTTGFSHIAYQNADKITNLCDDLAFYFCFEKPVSGYVTVYKNANLLSSVDIRFELSNKGVFNIDPWPFSVHSITNFITAYQEEGYPNELIPVQIEYKAIKSI